MVLALQNIHAHQSFVTSAMTLPLLQSGNKKACSHVTLK